MTKTEKLNQVLHHPITQATLVVLNVVGTVLLGITAYRLGKGAGNQESYEEGIATGLAMAKVQAEHGVLGEPIIVDRENSSIRFHDGVVGESTIRFH